MTRFSRGSSRILQYGFKAAMRWDKGWPGTRFKQANLTKGGFKLNVWLSLVSATKQGKRKCA